MSRRATSTYGEEARALLSGLILYITTAHEHDKRPTFIANVDVLQAFGTKDQFTADYVSKAAGKQTIFQKSTKRNKGKSGDSHRPGEGSSVSETGRRLVTPDEIRRMPTSKQLLFVENKNPLLSQKLFYLNDEEFRDEEGEPFFDENPLRDS